MSDLGGLTYGQCVTTLDSVPSFVGRLLTAIALCFAVGLQWVALQSLAWTTMVVKYAKCAPLREAIAQTFDGAHPCSLCHTVNQGKDSEKKRDVQSTTPKVDMICVAGTIRLLSPFAPFEYAARVFPSSDIGYSPPVPPPRFAG